MKNIIEYLHHNQRTISELHKFYIKDATFEQMIQKALDLIVEEFGYYMAWYAELIEKEKVIIPKLWAGKYEKYLDGLRLEYESDKKDAKCAMSIAILTKTPFGYADLKHDKDFEKWRAFALQYGYRSNQAIPLILDGKCKSSFLIYSSRSFAFSEKLIEYLKGIVNELATIIRNITERKQVEEALRKAHDELEIRVQVRTAELAKTNKELKNEITERKKAEESLKKKTRELSTILTDIEQGIAYLDENNIIIFLNKQYADLFGLKYEDVFGKNICDFFYPKSRKKIESLITEFRNGEKTLNFIESINDKFIDTTLHRIEDADENYQGILINVVDITERKRLETQFIQVQKMESVGQLAGGIAHDFNNILTVIIGNAHLALMSINKDNPIIENIMEIKNSADRATNLTRQLLAFSRRQIIEPRVIILNNIILEMDKMFGRLIGENIELVTIPAENLWPVKIDPGQIEQVLTNLVVNARDAIPKHGKLTIETANVTLDEEYSQTHAGTKSGDYVMMAVSDTGVGMDEETMLHIFEPFFTTKEHSKGTGLGLSTCYGIIKQNGGNIWVYSEQGHGTTFKIYLPRESGEPTNSLKRKNNFPKGTETILIAEDEPKVRQVTASILRDKGYTIYEAANGEEALRIAEKDISWNIHLLITDVIMPRMSGKELSEHFKIINPDIKVLFVSGYTDNSIVHHGILEPGIEFLQKPFSPHAIVQKVRQVLDE